MRGLLFLGFTLWLGFILFAVNFFFVGSPSICDASFFLRLLLRKYFSLPFGLSFAFAYLSLWRFRSFGVVTSSSFRSSSSSLRIFFFLGCPGIHSRVSRRFSLSSPSPTAIRLFPLDRSLLGSLSSLLLFFYPFGVFRRLRLLPLDFALALLFLEFFSSSRIISLRSCFFVCAVSSAGFYAPHVLSPSLCHLADPDFLLRVLARPLLLSSAPPF